MPSRSPSKTSKTSTDKTPSLNHLIRCLRYLSVQPSSFVHQQVQAILRADRTIDVDKHDGEGNLTYCNAKAEIRNLYKNFRPSDHDGPTLSMILGMKPTLQGSTPLVEDRPTNAEEIMLGPEQDSTKEEPKSVATTKASKRDIAIDLSSDSEEDAALSDGGPSSRPYSHSQLRARKRRPDKSIRNSQRIELRNRALQELHEIDTLSARPHPFKIRRRARGPASMSVSLGSRHPRKPVEPDFVRHRRPENKDVWYSHLVPDTREDWASGHLTQIHKRCLSNIANIEETIAGVRASSPCNHCQQQGFDCIVYDPDTVNLYCGLDEWQSCSHCWALGFSDAPMAICSRVQEHET